MTPERLDFANLNFNEGTAEQVAQRNAAHAIAYEVNRLEDSGRSNGWELLNRPKALEVAAELRKIATSLYAAGSVGLEKRVAEELARMRGYPCEKCGHKHEGPRHSYRCLGCLCDERPTRTGRP